MKKITEEWLKAATDDLKVIERIIFDENLTHMVAFHSQQAVEKSLKAVMEEYEIEAIRIHNLGKLFNVVAGVLEFDVDFEIIKMLDKLYVDARYPADLGLLPNGKPDKEDANLFYDTAQNVYGCVEDHLKKRWTK